MGHLARTGKVDRGRVAVLGRGPRYGTSRACRGGQPARVGWGWEGLERALQLVAHGTRPAFPSRKLEQRSDRQGQMGAGQAGGRWPQGWRQVDRLRGAEEGQRASVSGGRGVWLEQLGPWLVAARGRLEGQVGGEGRPGSGWAGFELPGGGVSRSWRPEAGEGGELFGLERSAQRPFQGLLISKGGTQVRGTVPLLLPSHVCLGPGRG